jgi:ribose-phosphate pyrophosphokinase
VKLAPIQNWQFSDGEVFACAGEGPEGSVRGMDCYILHDPFTDETMTVNDKLMQTFVLIHALRKASAKTVSWVERPPAYGRQDRKDKARRVATTQMMGMILDALRLDRLILVDPHSKVAADHELRYGIVDVLECRKLIADALVPYIDDPDRLVIQQPDTGGAERTEAVRSSLEKRLSEQFKKKVRIPLAYFNKKHSDEQETVTGDLIVGDVRGKDVILVDDIIATGGTIKVNREAIELNGGRLRYVAATHGYFTTKTDKKTGRKISAAEHFEGIEHVFVTDSVDPWRIKGQELFNRLHIIDTSAFVAQSLWETDNDGSINSLLVD